MHVQFCVAITEMPWIKLHSVHPYFCDDINTFDRVVDTYSLMVQLL